MRTGPKNILRKALFIALSLAALSTPLTAQDFTIESAQCLVRVAATPQHSGLNKIFKRELAKKDFDVKPFIDKEKIFEKELYAQFKVVKGPEKLYKKCGITISLHQAKGNRPRKSDKVLFKKTNERSVPRITFSGGERCQFAMKEAFIHMPKCVAMGFAGEKK